MNTLTFFQLATILENYELGFEEFAQTLNILDRKYYRLWQFLLSIECNYKDSAENRKRAFTAVYGKKTTYNSAKIRVLQLDLRKQLESFIYTKEITSTAQGQLLLAKLLNRNGHQKEATQAIEKTLSLAEDEKPPTKHYINFEAQSIQYFNGMKVSIENIKKEFDLYEVTSKLQLFIQELVICRGKGISINKEILTDIERLFSMLPNNNKSSLMLIQIKNIEYFVRPSREGFDAFKRTYMANVDMLDKIEKESLLNSLINAIIVFKNPDEKMKNEYLSLFRFGIEKKIFKTDNVQCFNNIVFIADAMKDYELIDLAITKLAPEIKNKTDRQCCLLTANAHSYFGKGEFAKAISIIKQIDKPTTQTKTIDTFRKQLLKLKCLYEVAKHSKEGYYNVVEQKSVFKNMLKRAFKAKKINEEKRTDADNFYRLLCKIANKGHSKKVLLKELKDYEGRMVETKWISEKIAELKE